MPGWLPGNRARLSQLEFLGAAGLTVFHRIETQLRAANGRLILHRPPPMARRMLAITGLDTVLTIRPATARNLAYNHQRGRVRRAPGQPWG